MVLYSDQLLMLCLSQTSVQYGIKKRDSDANVTSLGTREEGGRKKLSSAGLFGDVQANQGTVSMFS